MKDKRIMVDMSATLIHHGHIRLLKKAAQLGKVVVGLTTDEEIISNKGYTPEIPYNQRKEILESIKFVSEVVPTPWIIDETILDRYFIDKLIHGDDNSNIVTKEKLHIFPRTEGISSSIIRNAAAFSLTQQKNSKLMLTPGPAAILHDNITHLEPLFGRGDEEYTEMSEKVLEWVRNLSEQDEVVYAQGSATFGLELGLHTFVSGKVLLISTGYYSDRLKKLVSSNCELTVCKYDDIDSIRDKYDWVLCAYTETSVAFKIDIETVKRLSDKISAKLFVDATGSIGLEDSHGCADLMAFSSCKGLFGLTGASFIAFKKNLNKENLDSFYFNLETHKNKMVTGPYHAIASLYGVINNHNLYKKRVFDSKNYIIKKYKKIIRNHNQPALCTYLDAKIEALDNNVVLYSPRSELSGSVICHLGEIHSGSVNLDKRVKIIC